MHWKVELDAPGLAHELEQESSLSTSTCDGHGACTSACPVADAFDQLPHQIVRMVRLDARDRVLRTSALWLCTDCGACTAACPSGVDVARLFVELRRRSVADQVDVSPDGELPRAAHESVLDELSSGSGVSMARLGFSYKFRSMDLFADVGTVATLVARGRLGLAARGGDAASALLVKTALERERERTLDRQERQHLGRRSPSDRDGGSTTEGQP